MANIKNTYCRLSTTGAQIFVDFGWAIERLKLYKPEDIINDEDPWVIIIGLFSLGEIGPDAKSAIPDICKLLHNPSQKVVRQSLEALENIQSNINLAIPQIEKLLFVSNPNWVNPEVLRGWTAQD